MAERIAVTPARRARHHDTPTGATPGRLPRLVAQASASRPFRLPEVVIGVLLVAGCALLALLWNQSNNATTTIVVAARPIARGATIAPEDLRGTEITGETPAMIAGSKASVLLGQVALVDIAPDVPFTQSLLTEAAPLSPDEALTSMALAPGQLPPDLAPNDVVRLVVTAVPDAAGVAPSVLLADVATVWSFVPGPDGVLTIVTVRAPLSLSSEVAAASRVLLVRIEGR